MCEQPPPAKRPTFAVHDESPASRVQPAPATLSQHPANASRKPHIAVLPDDVVELILGWLPTRSRLRAMACCRRWYRIGWYSTYLWRILDLTSEEGVFVSLRHDAVQNVARRIQILQLVAARCIDAAESVTRAAPELRSLQRLNLAHTDANSRLAAALADYCGQLRVLILRGCTDWVGGCTAIIARGCAQLRYLDIGGTETNDNDLEAVAMYCRGLIHLSLRDTRVTAKGLAALSAPTAPPLVFLSVFGCRNLETSRAFRALTPAAGAPSAPLHLSLRRLDLRRCAIESDEDLSAAAVRAMQSLPRLQQLSLPQEVSTVPPGWWTVKFDRGPLYACVDPGDPVVAGESPLLYALAPSLPPQAAAWLQRYGNWLDEHSKAQQRRVEASLCRPR